MHCKYLVLTGSSGFLGKHLLHSFLSEKSSLTKTQQQGPLYRIYALYNSHTDFEKIVQDYAEQFKDTTLCEIIAFSLDLTDSNAINKWLKQEMSNVDVVDACIHLAAMANPNSCQSDPDLARSVNIPRIFFEALISEKKCPKIIALSTDHVYSGTNPPYVEEEEDQVLRPINVYGESKYEMEKYILGKHGPRLAICLRSSIILGTKAPIAQDSSHSTFLQFCATRKDQETTFWSDECRNVIWVGDTVAVLRWFADNTNDENHNGGVYNMGGPESVSRLDMAKAVFHHFGYDTKYLVAQEKKTQPQIAGGTPSPLDISMDSTRLQSQTKLAFATMDEIVEASFPVK
mmetsp:Transcript_7473/g.9727  ORF Transcript_7473/g.9727 Transcript_7473/m.9727 type:complete len:345 (-) Transcript_7473:331-1365(-)